MEKYINDAIDASGEDILLEAYDKEWALKDLGRREGYEEGYDSGFDDAKFEMVRNMLTEDANIDFISKVTGLTLEEIEKIKNNL